MIDQTWIRKWGLNVEARQILHIARWVAQQPSAVQQLAMRLPPHSLVRRITRPWSLLTEADWDRVPAPTTCGVVHSYSSNTDHVFVLQSPSDTHGQWVPVEELELAAPWAGLDRGYLQAVIHMEQDKQASLREALPSQENASNGKRRTP